MNGITGTIVNQSNDRKDSTEDSNSNPKPLHPKLQKTTSWLIKNKLSSEFDNVKDEAELGKLMGDDGEKLLNLVDDIRRIDKLRDIELDIPQVVVVGDTSTGKSSVLQALTRLPFPVASELCTRFVTETTIRRCAPSERPGYKIEVKMDSPGIGQGAPFPPKTFDSHDWTEVYQNLKEDIADAFAKMSPENIIPLGVPRTDLQPRPSNRSTVPRSNPVPQLLKHRLEISVRKPDQAHFSIVDIPGLVSSGAKTDILLSEELARRYIKNQEAIVLAITPADNVLVNQKWLNLVIEGNALNRTIGVITRCDRIENRNEGKIFDLLRNKLGSEHYLKLGWFAVRNRSPEEVIDEESFDERDKKEKDLFASGKWKEALTGFSTGNSITPDALGTQCLKRTLQRHLYKRVRENFPLLKSKMRALESQYDTQSRNMGDPRDNPRDQRVYLSDIQAMYEAEVERSLNGDYRHVGDSNQDSRLRYHVKKFNDEFESEMKIKAVKYGWQENDDDYNDVGIGILHWIHNTWNEHRGSEPRHDAPRSLKKELVMQQTESWETKTRSYIQKVEDAIKACNNNLFYFTCKDDKLRHNIREKLEAREIKAFEAAETELQNILRDRNYIDSWNPQLEFFIAELQRPRIERQVNQKQDRQASPGVSSETTLDEVSLRERFYSANKIFEIHDWLYAYWKVTYPRFVDNVIIQVVERHLLGPNGPLRLFNRNWIFHLSDEELQELVGENEETRDTRKELRQRLEGLQDALKRADIALR